MSERRSHLAFDLGAESGRAVLGTLEGGRIALREVHRFPNAMISLFGRLHWDPYVLYAEIVEGMKRMGLPLATEARLKEIGAKTLPPGRGNRICRRVCT